MSTSRSLSLFIALGCVVTFACGPKNKTGIVQGNPEKEPVSQLDPPAELTTAEIIAGSDLPELLPEALGIDPLGVEIHRLSNGMTVFISTNRKAPEFSARIAVRTGSRNDPANSTGLAHYLEHMLFKGSSVLATVDFAKEKPHLDQIAVLYGNLRDASSAEERKTILAAIDAETQKAAAYAIPNEFDQLYAGMGISGVNAFTSEDATVYVCVVPSNRLEAWAKVEGDRFADPQYRLFYPELEAVYEEKNRSEDSPFSRMFTLLSKQMFPNHPYGTQPTIGLTEHLKTPAYADMANYYKRWYVPNNMAIILAGDIDAKTALPVLEREFAKLEPKQLSYDPSARPAGSLAGKGRREAEFVAPGENAIYLAWRSPAPVERGAEVFEILDLLMDNATTGLLNTELVLSQKVPAAGSFVSASKEASMYIVWATAQAGQTHAELERLLQQTLAKLKQGEFDQQDIDAAIVNLEINEKQKLESNRARVGELTDAFINQQQWPAAVGRLARLRSVKKDQVIAAAKLLGDDIVVVKRMAGEFKAPKIDKPSITPVKIDTTKASPFAKQIKAIPAKPIDPQFLVAGRNYQDFKLPAGKLLTVHNTANDLFTLSYTWETGSKNDRLLCIALDAFDKSGTTDADAIALRKKLYALGTAINFSCTSVDVTATISGIDRNLEASVEHLRNWMAKAEITNDTVQKLVTNEISRRVDLISNPSFLSQAVLLYATRAGQTPLNAEPSNRQLKALGTQRSAGKQMAARVAKLLASAHETAYLGPRQPKNGDQLTAAIGLGKRHKKLRKRDAQKFRQVSKPTIYFFDKSVAQSQIGILWARKPLPMGQRPVSSLYSQYIGGGLGALIGQEIREARGLAYSAGGGFSRGVRSNDEAAITVRVGTQADKTTDALSAVVDLLRGHQIDDKRFAVARDTLLESFRSIRPDPRTTIGAVRSFHELGLNSDPRGGYFETITKMSASDFTAFTKGLVDGPMIISITGDKSRIDMDALKKIGTIVLVNSDQLTSW